MKKLVSLFALVFILAMGTSYAQSWTPLGNFPDDNFMGNTGAHGVAVDPDGKVWCIFYGATEKIFNGIDTCKYPCSILF